MAGLGAREAYVRTLRARAALDVANQIKGAREVFARQIKSLTEGQLRSTLDASFADVRVAEAELAVTRAENERAAAIQQLANAMGLEAPGDWEFDETTAAALPDNLETLLTEAVASRPELAEQTKRVTAAKLDALSDRRLSMPVISGIGVGGVIPVGDPRLRNHFEAVAVNLTVPLWNGRSFDARRQESIAKALAAEQELTLAVLQVRTAVRLAYLDWVTAKKNLEVAIKLEDQAARTLRLSESRYRVGLGSIMEFNQAQLDAAGAQFGHVSARYEVSAKQIRLEFEVGRYGR